jgi:hypothetical protein
MYRACTSVFTPPGSERISLVTVMSRLNLLTSFRIPMTFWYRSPSEAWLRAGSSGSRWLSGRIRSRSGSGSVAVRRRVPSSKLPSASARTAPAALSESPWAVISRLLRSASSRLVRVCSILSSTVAISFPRRAMRCCRTSRPVCQSLLSRAITCWVSSQRASVARVDSSVVETSPAP